jgi:hypothetical protein
MEPTSIGEILLTSPPGKQDIALKPETRHVPFLNPGDDGIR